MPYMYYYNSDSVSSRLLFSASDIALAISVHIVERHVGLYFANAFLSLDSISQSPKDYSFSIHRFVIQRIIMFLSNSTMKVHCVFQPEHLYAIFAGSFQIWHRSKMDNYYIRYYFWFSPVIIPNVVFLNTSQPSRFILFSLPSRYHSQTSDIRLDQGGISIKNSVIPFRVQSLLILLETYIVPSQHFPLLIHLDPFNSSK